MTYPISAKLALAAMPLVLGTLSGWIASKGPYIERQRTARVSFQPPGWVFSVVWPILYLLMGWTLFRMLSLKEQKVRKNARWVFWIFWIQLGLNVIWSPVNTYIENENSSLILLYAILFASFLTAIGLSKFDGFGAVLFYPYLVWLTFASYLACRSIQAPANDRSCTNATMQ